MKVMVVKAMVDKEVEKVAGDTGNDTGGKHKEEVNDGGGRRDGGAACDIDGKGSEGGVGF